MFVSVFVFVFVFILVSVSVSESVLVLTIDNALSWRIAKIPLTIIHHMLLSAKVMRRRYIGSAGRVGCLGHACALVWRMRARCVAGRAVRCIGIGIGIGIGIEIVIGIGIGIDWYWC